MIENYQDVMNEWGNPPVGCCSGTMQITPEVDLHRWAVAQTITVLANADYYYTKTEVDTLLAGKASSTHVHGNISNDGKLTTASRVVVTDASGNIDTSSVTSTELGYLSGVTSNIQTQLNGKHDDTNHVALTTAEIDTLMA